MTDLLENLPDAMASEYVGDYILFLDDVLGTGTFGCVVRALNFTSSKFLAAKILSTTGRDQRLMAQEIAVLRGLRHKNVISFFGYNVTGAALYLFLELASNGDLYGLVRKEGTLDDARSRRCFTEIMSGVEYLHEMGVVH